MHFTKIFNEINNEHKIVGLSFFLGEVSGMISPHE